MSRWQHAHRDAVRRSVAAADSAILGATTSDDTTDPVAELLADTLQNESAPPAGRLELRQADDSAGGSVFGSGGGSDASGSSTSSGGSSGGSDSSSGSSGSSGSSSGSSSSGSGSSSGGSGSSSSSSGGSNTYNIGGTTASAGSGSSSSSSSCPAGAANCSQKPSISSNTVPIVLGVVIPCVVAAVVFIIVIQKHRRRQRAEDLNDKHGSLDFGMGEVHRKQKGKKGKNALPEMTVTDMTGEKALHGKGLSMDLNSLGSPYVIAGDIRGKASFDSSARSVHDDSDPYAPIRSASKSPARKPTGSSSVKSDEKQGLLNGAATPSSNTPRSASPVNSHFVDMPAPAYNGNSMSRKPVENSNAAPPLPPKPEDPKPASNFSIPRNVDRSSISSRSNAEGGRKSPPPPLPAAPTKQPQSNGNSDMPSDGVENYANYTDMLGISQGPQDPRGPPPPAQPRKQPSNNLGVPKFNDPRRLSSGPPPLPPQVPTDDAEQRANRIRSFYKEYFDDSKPAADGAEHGYEGYGYDGYGDYYGGDYGDYGDYDGAAIWDPETGQFVSPGAPYGEPIHRGAMTPPPRFRGAAGGHRYTSSSGHSHGPRGRAHSSASGRHPGARGRPIKKLPPPKPLNNLPTPHLLKDDLTTLPAMDFAPPPSMAQRAQGRSQSPSLEQRPYSPSVKAYTPLQSAFKELTVMPSPHLLRKSGTFTGLDFAPPPKIRADGGGSDTSSIKSGRSGISAVQARNVRAGNYRVSRIGNANVGTKDDLAATLKPQWNISRQ